MREWSVAEEHHSYIVQVLIAETLVLLTIVFDTVPGVNDNAGRPTQLGRMSKRQTQSLLCTIPDTIRGI